MIAPYHDHQGITLYCGDCRAILPTLEPASFDVVIADPPYGDTSLAWDTLLTDWLPLVLPLLKPSGSLWLFGSMRSLLTLGIPSGWQLAQDLVWEKHNGSSFHADRFKRVHEHMLQFYPTGVAWRDVYKLPVTTPDATKRTTRRKGRPNHTGAISGSRYVSEDGGPRLARSVLYEPSCHGYAIHPTQKPVGILTPLLLYSCPPGGRVLVPFSGSAAVEQAAHDLGLEAVGIELNAEYIQAAAQRLAVFPLFLKSEAA